MKKSVLISCAPRLLNEVFLPIIHQLANEFIVVVTLMDYFVPPGLLEHLKFLEREGVLEKYFLIPIPRNNLKFFLTMRKKLEGLRAYQFDLWLTQSEMQLEERYISECILPQHCLRVVFWHNLTYLLKNEWLSRRLLGESLKESRIALPSQPRFFERIRKSKSILEVLKKVPPFLLRPLKRARKKFRQRVYRHIILPKLFMGKSFSMNPCDILTEIGSGRSDMVIFCDEIEAKAHQSLFKNSDVCVAQYPTSGSCRCGGDPKKNATLLSPLSGFVHLNQISEEHLSLFYRDFKTVLSQTGAEGIHLRRHPDETGRWFYSLRDYLLKRGIPVQVVTSERSLREVVCDYLGVAGFASCALRDCRAACDNIFVIGFVAISKYWAPNPKFSFGQSEGIGWIEDDGSYNPGIFSSKKFVPISRKNVFEILKEGLESHSLKTPMKRVLHG